MKTLIKITLVIAFAFMSFLSNAQNNTTVYEIRDSLSKDIRFRNTVRDIMYGVAIDVSNDTTAYAASVRPFFDRYLTNPNNSVMIDMFTMAVLNHPSVVIDLDSEQSVYDQLLYALRTVTLWKAPVDEWVRQTNE